MLSSITQRLVLSLLGLVFILVAALALTKWGLDRGFLEYINQHQHEKLGQIADGLKESYINADNSWRSLTQDEFNIVLAKYAEIPKARLASRPGPSHQLRPPIGLYDTNDQPVVGTRVLPANDLIITPVAINGEAVGYLKSESIPAPSSPNDEAFIQQQLTMIVLIGVGSIFVALLISYFLSRSLLGPIRQMENRVEQLSSGDYSDSDEVSRKDELGRLLENINHLGKKLASNKASRSEWLANITHELRTPLTVILGEIEAFKDGIRSFDQRNLQILEKESQRLKGLVDDLYELSVSDIGGLRYKFEAVDLSACLSTVVDSMKCRATDNGIYVSVKYDENATINGDCERLDRLFHNLLDNSMTYTDSPGEIIVHISSDNDWVKVAIEDSAPGVSSDQCKQLFEPLYRTDESRNRRSGGAGLGLAICRSIVEAHRGLIKARPSSLGGICIELQFPSRNRFSI